MVADCEQSLQMRALDLQGGKDAAEASAQFSGDSWFVSQGLLGLLTPAILRSNLVICLVYASTA